MLELNGISHSYGDRKVLQNIRLNLQRGQRIALMGPSGCGKTTLLRIALGLLTPTEGSVKNSFRKTTAVFQEPRLLPWRTALENVNLVLGDGKATRETAAKYLEQVKLSEAADQYPRELSGGMQQRVAVARALAAEGDFLVLDEPFKAMDEALREQIIQLVAGTDAAILLVTHEEAEARILGCEIIRL